MNVEVWFVGFHKATFLPIIFFYFKKIIQIIDESITQNSKVYIILKCKETNECQENSYTMYKKHSENAIKIEFIEKFPSTYLQIPLFPLHQSGY